MGRLTIDIPEGTHHRLRLKALNEGVTIRAFVLSRIEPELPVETQERSLRDMAAEWKCLREGITLEREGKTLREIAHAGHEW